MLNRTPPSTTTTTLTALDHITFFPGGTVVDDFTSYCYFQVILLSHIPNFDSHVAITLYTYHLSLFRVISETLPPPMLDAVATRHL